MNTFKMVIGGDFIPTADNAERMAAGDVEGTFGDVADYFKKRRFFVYQCGGNADKTR